MRQKVDVEQILDDVIAETRHGAHPWKIADSAAKSMRRRYEPGFRETLDRYPRWWQLFSEKVLRMSRCVGTFASFFAETAGQDRRKDVVAIEPLMMALGVAKFWCTAGRDAGGFGPPCEYASIDEGVPSLKTFLQDTMDRLSKSERSIERPTVARAARSGRRRPRRRGP